MAHYTVQLGTHTDAVLYVCYITQLFHKPAHPSPPPWAAPAGCVVLWVPSALPAPFTPRLVVVGGSGFGLKPPSYLSRRASTTLPPI